MEKIEILGIPYEKHLERIIIGLKEKEKMGKRKKMNRRTFTKNIAKLLIEMVEAGDMPVIDYCLRSKEEQRRLFDKGISGCDGTIKKSAHQSGKAMDIYLVKKRKNGSIYVDYAWNDEEKKLKWHRRWEELGGRKMITFKNKNGKLIEDRPHFEG